MEFEQVLQKRHSVRKFQKKEISEETIQKILQLANLSPSAGNLQARSVVIVKERAVKEKISDIALGQTFIAQAPVVFVICAETKESEIKYGEQGRKLYSIQDATIFASYLQLAATSYGLSSCWVGAFKENELREILDLPAETVPIAIIPVGVSDESPYITSRKSLEKLIKKKI